MKYQNFTWHSHKVEQKLPKKLISTTHRKQLWSCSFVGVRFGCCKKSTKPCLVDFLEVLQMFVHDPSPKLRCSLCILVFQLLCFGTFWYHSCFIILSLSTAYARPTLSRTNESILHVTESILAPNKQCSLHFGSRSNPSPLFSSLRLNWVEYLNLSRIRLQIDQALFRLIFVTCLRTKCLTDIKGLCVWFPQTERLLGQPLIVLHETVWQGTGNDG